DGEERQALERTAKALGVENRVEFFGAVSEEKLYGLLKGCRCFAFPSYEEGYGIAIAEAILAQRPVVAYALPHYKEVFNDALTVVPLGDIQALAKAITNVLEADVDQSRLQERYKDVKIWSANEAAEFELNAATGRV
ncbi:MAG: glycosyltransferase, partial [Verrucomicrobia bacterium]|nr:glycosyltransferase [Verrucomicrobiota bacterium]